MTKATLPPSRTADQFVVRLPAGMRDTISEAAKASNRSMNAEIVARLQGEAQTTPALIEAIARLNLSLAEREYDLQLAETTIEQMADALRLAYRTIKNSPIEHLAMDCLDEIEDLVTIRADTRSHPDLQRKRAEEKFSKLRLAQGRVAEISATHRPTPDKGSSESADPLPMKRVTRAPQKKATEGVQVHPPAPKKTS